MSLVTINGKAFHVSSVLSFLLGHRGVGCLDHSSPFEFNRKNAWCFRRRC